MTKTKWIILSIVIAILFAGIILIAVNFKKIESWFNKETNLYTSSELEEAYNDGYEQGIKLEVTLKERIKGLTIDISRLNAQVSNLENQVDVKQSEILELSVEVATLNGQIDSLNEIITARDNTISDLNSEIAELQAKVLDLKEQLLKVFENQYNNGFNDAVDSFNPQEIYDQAYDVGYNAGFAKQEKIYEEIEAYSNVVWNGEVDTLWYTADKQSLDSTYDSITGWYIIYKPSQLAGLAQLVNSGTSFKGETISLMNNMYLNDTNSNLQWTTIGTSSNSFKGTFYGNSHFISGLFINRVIGSGVGLFGNINNALIYNVGLVDSYISSPSMNVGALAGFSYDSEIRNCVIYNVEIEAYSSVGGLIGSAKNTEVENCYVTCNIEAYTFIGGLVGQVYENFECLDSNVISDITVIDLSSGAYTDSNTAGGLIGIVNNLNPKTLTLDNIKINTIISAPNYSEGLFNSLRTAVSAKVYAGLIGKSIGNITATNIILLADLPLIDTNTYEYVYSYVVGDISDSKNNTHFDINIDLNYNSFTTQIYNSQYNSAIVIDTLDFTISELDIKSFNIDNAIIIEIVESTCEENGFGTFECYYCGYIFDDIINSLGHNYVEIERVEATEYENGYVIYECSNCGEQYTEIIESIGIATEGLLYIGLDINGDETVVEENIVSYMIGRSSGSYLSSFVDVVIPMIYNDKPVIAIKSWAFDGCSNLRTIKIPNSIISIGQCAFRDCSSLESVKIPNSVTSIGQELFSGCFNLESVELSENITSIDYYTFSGCSSLTSIIIPENVTTIGGQAFYNCSNLVFVVVERLNSLVLSVHSIDSMFLNCSSLESIYVPANLVNSYKVASGWSNYSALIKAIV